MVFSVAFLYMYYRWRSSYQEGCTWISLTGLTPPRLGAYPKTSNIMLSWSFVCSVSEDEMWLSILLILVELWPSLFKLFYLLIYMCTFQTNRWSSLTAFAIWYIGAMWCQLWNRNYCGQTQQHIPNMSLTNTQASFFSV
jgi:hypothetical protein